MNNGRRPGKLALVGIGACLVIFIVAPSFVRAQSSDTAADWEKAAGGKMSFDVASIKQDTSGQFFPPKFPLSPDDSYPGNMTLFTSGLPLAADIAFAFKLPVGEQSWLQPQLPKWAQTETFDIEARAAVPSTKDQMRLMMQSLLEERFKLKAHFETEEKPVFALVLVKPGKTGPQLRPYAADPPCTNTMQGPTKMAIGELTPVCYALMLFPISVNGATVMAFGSRNVSMRQIANSMGVAPTANLDRPVIDKTSLSGNFDFVMNFAAGHAPGATDSTADNSAPTFLEALKDQLGLKLEPTTAPVTTLVIDHIEEPTPN